MNKVSLFFSKIGLFTNTTGNISNGNEVNITPAGWTFSTWGIIYTWQALWLIFNIFLIFRRHEMSRLYREPPVLTIVFHILMFSNFALNITWLFLWDRQYFTVISITFGVIICILDILLNS